jgi:hypothetical protein
MNCYTHTSTRPSASARFARRRCAAIASARCATARVPRLRRARRSDVRLRVQVDSRDRRNGRWCTSAWGSIPLTMRPRAAKGVIAIGNHCGGWSCTWRPDTRSGGHRRPFDWLLPAHFGGAAARTRSVGGRGSRSARLRSAVLAIGLKYADRRRGVRTFGDRRPRL